MPDPENTPDEELTEGQTGILDTLKSAVGLDESTDEAPPEPEAEPDPEESPADAARRKYRAGASDAAARKRKLMGL